MKRSLLDQSSEPPACLGTSISEMTGCNVHKFLVVVMVAGRVQQRTISITWKLPIKAVTRGCASCLHRSPRRSLPSAVYVPWLLLRGMLTSA